MSRHRKTYSWNCFVACAAIGAAMFALTARTVVAQATEQTDNSQSVDEDLKTPPAARKLQEKALLAVPATPPTPPAPPRKPSKGDDDEPKRGLFGGQSVQQKAQVIQEYMQALQKQQEQLAKQQEQLGKQFEELSKGMGGKEMVGGAGMGGAMGMGRGLPKTFEWNFQRDAQKKLEYQAAVNAANGLAEANPQFKIVAPLPANAVVRAFKLQYVKPDEIGQALHNITGGGGPRIAIDERTNALLIAGDDKQMDVVKQVVETLDQPSIDQKGKNADTLQVRVVWVLDSNETDGKPAEPPFVNSEVVDGLRDLGFKSPRVMCQQVTTLTFGREREGQFQFEVPVLAEGSPWEFNGNGVISPASDDRYSIQFTLGLNQPDNPHNTQIGGSILTPLGHYTVMGTSTFVAERDKAQFNQHSSAFVIFLDRAQEFGGKQSDGKKK